MKTFLYILSVIQVVSALIAVFAINDAWMAFIGVFTAAIGLFISTILLERQIKLEEYNETRIRNSKSVLNYKGQADKKEYS